MRKSKSVLEGGNGIDEEVDPSELRMGGLARVIGGEPIGNGRRSVIRLDRRRQERERHQFRRALHVECLSL